MSLKFTGDLCVMTITNDAKIEEELTCQIKIGIRNLKNFHLSTPSSNMHFNRPLLTKGYDI